MASETIVAVFETASAAEAAIASLIESGVPESAIQHYGQEARDATTALGPIAPDETSESFSGGFWGWLTGEKADNARHRDEYDRSITSGRNIVTVIADEREAPSVIQILEHHSPVDLEEHDADVPNRNDTTASAIPPTGGISAGTPAIGTPLASEAAVTGGPERTPLIGGAGQEQVLPLSEEELEVGKRNVIRGTTRIRRYVVERPVEEQVRLRNEVVSVFRRPVIAGTAVAADAFTDKVIEMTETDEEAVVAKIAHVSEEVVLRKEVAEHEETVRDTLRREEVEIVKLSGDNVSSSDPKPPMDKPMV